MIMLVKNDLIVASRSRIKNLDELIQKVKNRSPFEVETKDNYLRRIDVIKSEGSEPLEFAEERLMGKNDLMPLSYLEKGMIAAKSVGKVNVFDQASRSLGSGTGFLIAPGLIITNHHVIKNTGEAVKSTFELNFQRNILGQLLKSYLFNCQPNSFFYTNEDLDFTVVAVNEVDIANSTKIDSFSYLYLNPQLGKISTGESLSIVQHPEGKEKRIAIRENQLIEHDSPNFIWYQTDTTPGSSGSPVFNDEWQVIALHHMGVPVDAGDGYYLKKDGTKVKPDDSGQIDSEDLQWKANEGVRVSEIVKTLLDKYPNDKYIKHMQIQPPQELFQNEQIKSSTTKVETMPQTSNINRLDAIIPLHVSIKVDNVMLDTRKINVEYPDDSGNLISGTILEEKNIIVDQHYGNREGYDENFLGTKISLPRIPKNMEKSVATLKNKNDSFELYYYHYTAVFNKDRRMPFFGAANFDGGSYSSIADKMPSRKEIGTDKWYTDTRINETYQLPKKFYENNDWDMGHMVRREEVVYGNSVDAAIRANNDTFHLTNACPQHKLFNQGKTLWQGIENYVLDNARAHNLRITIITGPIFGKKDKEDERNGIKARIPSAFWKVVIMPKEDGELSATGYLASQEKYVEQMLEEFTFGQYMTYQVPISKIEKLTGLTFSLNKYDPKAKSGDVLHETVGRKKKIQPIEILQDVEF
jgi:endonuclease G, mitochondrial